MQLCCTILQRPPRGLILSELWQLHLALRPWPGGWKPGQRPAYSWSGLADNASVEIHIDERKIPVREEVQGACEILGFDPLYVANEGTFAAFVNPDDSEKTLDVMRKQMYGEGAVIIGEVKEKKERGLVTMTSKIGANRIVDMLSGEQLPRIC